VPVNLTNLVRLTGDDAGEILTLQRAAYVTEAQVYGDPMLPPLIQTLDELRAEMADPQCAAWGIRESHRLVASVRVHLIGEATAEVGRLVVAPDSQSNGLGTALLLAAEEHLPDEVTTVRLFTGNRSHGNLRLYKRLGYQETARTPAGSYELVYLSKAHTRADDPQLGNPSSSVI
jgi:ribosomal protein S18 acetylase RimI-like enzyme